ncbi:MAG: hypothetical protein V4733_10150 [Verrucomicrobiota bacterium]
MKVVLILLSMAGTCLLGYFIEPSLRFKLTGLESKTSRRPVVEAKTPAIDLSTISPMDLPESVTLKSPLKVKDAVSGVSMTLDAGSQLKPIRIEDGKLVVSIGNSGPSFPVDAAKTDLAAVMAANDPFGAGSSDSKDSSGESVPAEKTDPFGDPIPSEEKTPPADDSDAQNTAPAPAISVDPFPTPATAAKSEPSGTVAVMKEHLRSNAVKEFSFAQVLEWKEGTSETLEGETFQTGIAVYQVTTTFGVKLTPAKALIRDDKVVRWVSTNGNEIH